MKQLFMPALLALLAVPVALQAHVTANPNQGAAGSYFQSSFRISHGCDGSDTKEVRIKIPDGIMVVHPQFKPGWKAKTITRSLDKEVQVGHGKTVKEAPAEVVWTGGTLPDDQYDDFGLVMKLPQAPRKTLWFPVTQICDSGENKWTDIPEGKQEWHALKKPAPFVNITAP